MKNGTDDTPVNVIQDIESRLEEILAPKGLEQISFDIDWYNSFRSKIASGSPQHIRGIGDHSLAFLIISNKKFFLNVAETSKLVESSTTSQIVNETTDRLLHDAVRDLSNEYSLRVINLDRPPYLHAQSLGFVSGMTEYVESSALDESIDTEVLSSVRDADIWGTNSNRVLGVSLHPRYGGWFAFRALIVFENVRWPQCIPPPIPLSFLSGTQKKEVLYEYNCQPDVGLWRDYHDGSQGPIIRYDATQYAYFHEKSTVKRRRMLELISLDPSAEIQ